jgi:iron complex outermembrane recepter protein
MSAYKARYCQGHIIRAMSVIAILTTFFASAATYAQTANSPAVTAATNGLDEIVVTAQKRSENLFSVAAPVTALQAADLERQGDVRLSDYAASVPGLNLLSSEAGQSVVILRGITTGFGYAIPSTTSTYIDDTPFGSSTANAYGSVATLDVDPGMLQRIEVLRGPQGTLYGASSLGGLIKYVTRPPSLTEYSGRVELDGSAIDGGGQGGGVRAMFDGPLINNELGITIGAFDRLDPGYIDDPHRNRRDVNNSRVDGGRVALLWQPTEQFSAELTGVLQDYHTANTSNVDVNPDLTPIYGKYQQVRYGDENWDLNTGLYSLRATYDFGWASLTSISSYATRTARTNIDETVKFGSLLSSIIGVPNLALFDNITLNNDKATQEIRLASPDSDTFEWLGGFFYTHEHSVKPEALGNPFSTVTGVITPVAGGIFTDTLYDSYTEYAGYADLTYHFTSQFKILAGLRFTSNSETSVTPFSGILFGPPTVDVGKSSDNNVTYLFSPSYNFDAHNMLYARIASGYRPGGPTGVAASDLIQGAPETYKPDKLTNYEVGYKATFPEQRMTIDVSGFDIEWKNIQVLVDTNGFFVTGNGANARSRGLELAWSWKPMTGLSLSANAAYTHAYLTSDAPAIGGTSGEDLPDVPKFAANVAADYDFSIAGAITGFVGGSFQYQGSRHIDFIANTPAAFVPPDMPKYTTGNLHAGVNRGGLTFEAYIKNVGNSYGITRLASEVRDGYDAPLAASIIQPRTFGISIISRF